MRAAILVSRCSRTGLSLAAALFSTLLWAGCSGGDKPADSQTGQAQETGAPVAAMNAPPAPSFAPLEESLAQAAQQPVVVRPQRTAEEEQPQVRLTGHLKKPVTMPTLPDPGVVIQVNQLLEIAGTAQQKNDFAPARRFLEQALQVCRQHWPENHWRVIDIKNSMQYHDEFTAMSPEDRETIRDASRLHSLAYQRAAQNNYEQALDYLQQAQAKRLPILGEQHITCVRSRSDIVQWKIRLGQFEEAQALASRALEETIQVGGEVHPETAVLLWALGDMQTGLENPAEADKYYQRALFVFRTAPSSPDEYPQFLSQLSVIYQRESRFEEAEQCLLEAAEIRRQTKGETSAEYAGTLMYLGTLYLNTNSHALADAALTQAASRTEGQPDLAALRATVMVYLSRSAIEQGNMPRAQEYADEALAIRAATSGRHDAMYAHVLFLLSDIHMRKQEYTEALTILPEAANVYKLLGRSGLTSHSACVHRLVLANLNTGNLQDARRAADAILESHRVALDPDSPLIAGDLALQARVCLAEGDAAQAESLSRQAIAMLAEQENQEIRLSFCQHALGDALAAQGRSDEAAVELQKALDTQNGRLRVGDLYTLFTTESYASVLHQLGRDQEAAEFESQAAAFRGRLASAGTGPRR